MYFNIKKILFTFWKTQKYRQLLKNNLAKTSISEALKHTAFYDE